MRDGAATSLAIGAMLAARIAFATGVEEASACGIDPTKSRFETTHYRGGDVMIVVAVDEDGRPRAAFDAGPAASRVIASGRSDGSIFPASPSQGGAAALPVPRRVLVVCEPERRKVVLTEPLAGAGALPGLQSLPAHSGWFCDEQAPRYFADAANSGQDRFAASAESAPTTTGFERRTSWIAFSPAWRAEHSKVPACSLTQDLVLCRNASHCNLAAPAQDSAAPR